MDQLESRYECGNASEDLYRLIERFNSLKNAGNHTDEQREEMNRLENQIRFIRNKCDIPGNS